MFCPKCGSENENGVKFCASCGSAIEGREKKTAVAVSAEEATVPVEASIESHSTAQGATVTTINVQTPQVKRNPMGVAGFVMALLGVFLSWVPILGWLLWALGGLFSVIGLFKKPKGMAIAGVVLTFIDLILLLFVVASCTAVTGGIAAMM